MKSKGADVFLEDQEGLTAAELLRRKDKPKEAAALEGREMNAEEPRSHLDLISESSYIQTTS